MECQEICGYIDKLEIFVLVLCISFNAAAVCDRFKRFNVYINKHNIKNVVELLPPPITCQRYITSSAVLQPLLIVCHD